MPNIESILRQHTTLQVECIDRLYLHGYVPGLQRPNQLAYFLSVHRKKPLPSPALLGQMTERFAADIRVFPKRQGIPVVQFKAKDSKDEISQKHFARFRAQGREEGVVFIGVAQEFDRALRSTAHRRQDGSVASFDFYRASVAVKHYYFYIFDRDWGPGFIKFSSYVPFEVRVCLNGHEWAKRQLERLGIAFEALDNGFLSCANPQRLQQLCDRLGPEHVESFFRRWLARIPHPFTRRDRFAGYRYQLSIWQMEFSLTHVFDRPLYGRYFFEEVLRENLDLGRPDRIQLLFARRVKRTTPSSFRTRVVQHGVMPKLSVQYKHSRVKQYFKLGWALRTETVINNPYDVGVRRSLPNLPYLRTVARNVNRRLLALERTSHNCVIAHTTLESLVLPTKVDEHHAPSLRFGDPRVMAVLASLCHFLPTPDGFPNRLLRPRIAALLPPRGEPYTAAQMSYDLRRLRLKRLIRRLPGSNRYCLTPMGRRVALFVTKLCARILRPGLARLDPAAHAAPGDPLVAAWNKLERTIEDHVRQANLAA